MASPSTMPMLSPDGQVGDVPTENVPDAVKAGHRIAQDMLSPDGQEGVIPLDQVHSAIGKGFQLKGAAPKPPSTSASSMQEAPEATGAWEKFKQWGLKHFGSGQGTTSENAAEAERDSPLGAAKQVGGMALDATAGTVQNAAQSSAPYVMSQIYKSLKGEPNDLKSIPAASMMTFLAAGGVPEGEAGEVSPVAKAGDAVSKLSKGLKGFLDRFKSHAEAEDEVDEAAHDGTPETDWHTSRRDATRQNVPYAGEEELAETPATKTETKTGTADLYRRWPPADQAKPFTQKDAARKAFLDEIGKTKEDIDAAQAKAKIAYQKHLTKQAQKGAQFGPKGGATPELHAGAKQAGHEAYLKHLGITEEDFQRARGSSFRGAIEHTQKATAELLKKAAEPKP